ncbi:MAG TPA: hypothetical protein VFG95_10715 [Nitrospiria bacterium]|nr:hypothetical protein [Nitrospiria bacterium]
MSEISAIADHFLSSRSATGPKRIGLIGAGGAIPVSFLAANLAARWAGIGKRVMAVEGEEGGADLGEFLWGKPLPLLEDGEWDNRGVQRHSGIDLVPFCVTPDRLGHLKPAQWDGLVRREEEADLFLATLPGNADLFLWKDVVRSLHEVILQSPMRENEGVNCYRVLRFLHLHNPFLRVHLVEIPRTAEGGEAAAAGGMSVYDHLSDLAERFLRQELFGPYLLTLEKDLVHALLDHVLSDRQHPSLIPLLERLTRGILAADEPSIAPIHSSGFFASLRTAYGLRPTPWWEKADLFGALGDYFPLDAEVGPKKLTLLLNWERRLAVGETARRDLGEALIRGIVSLAWVHDHLPLLSRLYGKKIDPTLSPHLVLLSDEYPIGFLEGISCLTLSAVLYRVCQGGREIHFERVSPELKPSLPAELTPDEEEALQVRRG